MADINSYALKFTEEKYATKDEVAKHFNMSSVDNIWKFIIDYRKNLTQTLELPSIDRTKFSLVYTRSINNKLLEIERFLNRAYFGLGNLSSKGQEIFKKRRYVKILRSLVSSLGLEISDDFLMKMVNNELSTIPTDMLVVENYLHCLNYIAYHDAGKYSFSDFNSLNHLLESGSETTQLLETKNYRTAVIEEPHYYTPNYVYKAAINERISDMVDSCCDFGNDESQFASVRAIGTLFYFDYIMPYEYFRNENSCLAFKLCLARSGFSKFATYIDIENMLLHVDDKLVQIKDTTQKTFDLTYYFDYVLNCFKDDLLDIFDDLVYAQKYEVSFESKISDLSDVERKIIEEPKEEEEQELVVSGVSDGVAPIRMVNMGRETSSLPLYGESKVALPIFPQGLQEKDVDNIVVDLLETYPTLKKTQAHFYAKHCTIGKSYTIQQFKNEEETSYETARKSMDYLSEMGFYEKAKLRNKFVYKPIPRR